VLEVFMKKIILLAVCVLALGSKAQSESDDPTFLLPVYNYGPQVVVGGALPVYNQPVVYNGPVYYNGPVIYNGPVFYYSSASYNLPGAYDADLSYSTVAACLTTGCQNIYTYYPGALCYNYFYPNMIRFGSIQARLQGYHFNHRR